MSPHDDDFFIIVLEKAVSTFKAGTAFSFYLCVFSKFTEGVL